MKYMLLIGAAAVFASCGNNPLDVDVSSVNVEPVKIQRFDQDFFALNAGNISQQLPELCKKYGAFTNLFTGTIVCPQGIEDSICIPEITRFVKDKDMRAAYDACLKTFGDLKPEEEKITDIFRHYSYYFPKKKLPRVFAIMSGFNYSIAASDSVIALGLEMFLGKNYSYYELLQYPSFKQLSMAKAYIPASFARAWMMKEFPNTNKSETLLNEMIYQGKLFYLTDALMPEENDTLKIGFTKKQLDWCFDHEKEMWGYLIENKALYSTEHETIAKYTGEGPFTTGFVKESPARTGVWIGWRIVKKYMEENRNTTLEQLMNESDAQIILAKSKYKP